MAARKRKSSTKKTGSGERGKLARIGALWIKSGKNGKYLAGTIDIDDRNSVKLMVFPNGYKENERHPDYVIYAPPSGEMDSEGRPLPALTETSLPGMDNIGAEAKVTDDDIPF